MKTAIAIGIAVLGGVGVTLALMNVNAVRTRFYRLPALP